MSQGVSLQRKQRKRSVGIDLGTTYCCLAVMHRGKVEIVANDQDDRTTPSYVAFTNTEILIGDPAKKQIAWNLDNIENTVFDAKRLLGRKFDDPIVQSDMINWTFKVVSDGDAGKPKYQIKFKGEEKTCFPEEISYMILKMIKRTAESYLDGAIVKDAVITVPAYFNDAQRQATKQAAESAGFNVLRLLNEPTAAAIAYGLEMNIEEECNILVFDLGGGTFDVSIVNINKGVFDVKSTAGNTHLGGRDFDTRMVNYLLEEFKSKFGEDPSLDTKANKRAIRLLQDACEHAKHTLSVCTRAYIDINSFYNGKNFHTSISRAKFEELCDDLFNETLKEVEKALNDANMDNSDIDDIVLVGGSTRIPKVQNLLQEFFHGKKLNKSINPDEAIAYGAAVQAAKLSGDKSVKDFELQDVNPLSLGVKGTRGENRDAMSIIIKRNSKIPIKKSIVCSNAADNQESIVIEVYEGENTNASDNNLLGRFVIEIAPVPRSTAVITITFDIGDNGILEVTAKDNASGNMENIRISNDNNQLNTADIARMLQSSLRF